MAVTVDPFVVPIPRKILNDPELRDFFVYQARFLHDLWQRTGAGQDNVAGAAQTTGDTFTGNVNLSSSVLQVDGTQVVTAQQAAVADAAVTASNPAAITEYTPHASGAVNVTSNAATDLDTTAAALDLLVDETQALEGEVSALVVDVTDIKDQLNDLLGKLRTHGLIAT